MFNFVKQNEHGLKKEISARAMLVVIADPFRFMFIKYSQPVYYILILFNFFGNQLSLIIFKVTDGQTNCYNHGFNAKQPEVAGDLKNKKGKK